MKFGLGNRNMGESSNFSLMTQLDGRQAFLQDLKIQNIEAEALANKY